MIAVIHLVATRFWKRTVRAAAGYWTRSFESASKSHPKWLAMTWKAVDWHLDMAESRLA